MEEVIEPNATQTNTTQPEPVNNSETNVNILELLTKMSERLDHLEQFKTESTPAPQTPVVVQNTHAEEVEDFDSYCYRHFDHKK